MVLMATDRAQPVRMSDVFGTPRDTPVNNPWLSGYWDNYAAREAAFQNQPGTYQTYGQAPVEEPQTNLQSALNANKDVYRPRPAQSDGGSYPGFRETDPYPGGFTGLLEDLNKPFSGVMESIKDAYNPYDNLLGLVGADARGFGKAAGVAGLLGGGPLAFGAEALAGLAEMSALNSALTGLGKSTGREAPQIGIWDAIGAGFNPFSDLQDVAQDYYADMYGPDSYGEFGDMGAYDTEAVLNPSAPGSAVTYSEYSPEPDYSYEDGYDGGDSAGSMSGGGFGGDEGYGGPSF